MATQGDWLPLFPLNTVLFPAGVLPLRVFEARYVDMIRQCMKNDAPFGVVRIISGQEVGKAAVPDAVGCLAHIVQWDMQDLGVLLIRTEGGMRFRIREKRILPDQRLEARVDMIADDPAIPVTAAHVDCAKALKTVIDDVDRKGRQELGAAFVSPFTNPARLDEAAWVANRWCEILPVSLEARQKLLEIEGADSRLAVVHDFLRQNQII
ncbi:MAG: ATP-dependent protease [Herminiimonas sp.]|nr:ATP-dependent protease [Herminiimonas sp.]